MIKFLLHWWRTTPKTEKNKIFFQKAVELWGSNILIFPFSQKNKDYLKQFEEDKQKFIDNNPNKDLTFTMASINTDILTQQIKEHQSLYFCGGLVDNHIEILHQIKDLKTILDNKVIIGNSAGSQIWVNTFFCGDSKNIKKWINLLPIKLMVHRESDKYLQYNNDALYTLQQSWEELPLYIIKEQEYKYFEI